MFQRFLYTRTVKHFRSLTTHCWLRNTMSSSENGKQLVIGTHSGLFHCDEILACFMLQQLPTYKNAKIIRSRDDAVLNECDIVVDVGAIYDPEKFRFDHHQKTFEHTLGSLRPEYAEKFSKVRLSSAGLIYTHFGEAVIRQLLEQHNIEVTDDCLRNIFIQVYDGFIQEIDGIDNGVPQHPDEPVYRISTHLSARVGQFNSQWNSTAEFDEQAQFEKGKALAGEEFTDKVLFYATVWWPARAIVEEAVKERFNVHPSGKIIELKKSCPWKNHLFNLEEVHKCSGEILYCVAESDPNDHRVICVPLNATSFVCRKFLPASWRGVRDADLASKSGIKDAKFCHATGFIGGAKSRDAALEMAIKSLESTERD